MYVNFTTLKIMVFLLGIWNCMAPWVWRCQDQVNCLSACIWNCMAPWLRRRQDQVNFLSAGIWNVMAPWVWRCKDQFNFLSACTVEKHPINTTVSVFIHRSLAVNSKLESLQFLQIVFSHLKPRVQEPPNSNHKALLEFWNGTWKPPLSVDAVIPV